MSKEKRKGKDIIFDDSGRREWLVGFHKRKLERKKQGAEGAKLMEIAKKRFERQQRRQAEELVLKDIDKEKDVFAKKQARSDEDEEEDEEDDEEDEDDEEEDKDDDEGKKATNLYRTHNATVTVTTKPIESEEEEEENEEGHGNENAEGGGGGWTRPQIKSPDEFKIKKLVNTLVARSHKGDKKAPRNPKSKKLQQFERKRAKLKKEGWVPVKGSKNGKGVKRKRSKK